VQLKLLGHVLGDLMAIGGLEPPPRLTIGFTLWMRLSTGGYHEDFCLRCVAHRTADDVV
jgi:hypothetical protein